MLFKYIDIVTKSDLHKLIESAPRIKPEEDIADIWMVSVNMERVSCQELAKAVREMLRLAEQNFDTLSTFYLWFDEAANQIRFNSVEGVLADLPFKCTVQKVDSVDALFEQCCQALLAGELTWDEIEECGDDDEEDFEEYILPVFVKTIGTKN